MLQKMRMTMRWIADWARRVITQPREELTRWQATVRFGYDLTRHGARQLGQDRAAQMAAALAYRTLFGLLPVIVVATVVARALMGREDFLGLAEALIESLRLDEIEFSLSATDAPETTEDVAAAAGVSLGEWLQGIFAKALNINLTAIGWIGLVVVVYSAIGLMVTIENAFNRICRAPEGRSWMGRVTLYWFILTISPLAIGLIFWFDNRVDGWIEMVGAWQWLLTALKVVWSFIVVWLLMVVIYTLIPNTPVAFRSSLVGAFVAAVLLQAGTRLFGVYVDQAVSFRQIYGSLGLIPLFMFWVYMMWLVVLFGLEVASTLYSLRGRRFEEIKQRKPGTGVVDPAAVVLAMEHAARYFDNGEPFHSHDISTETGIDEPLVKMILNRLASANLVHEVAHPAGAYTLARPPEQVEAERLLQIGFSMVDEDTDADAAGILERLRAAQMQAAAGVTLATLVPRKTPEAGP